MRTHTVEQELRGPWSLATSRKFWEGFTPAALGTRSEPAALSTVFRVEADWSRAEASITQSGNTAIITVTGDGDLDEAAAQTARFLALDVDGRGWPDVAQRDPVIADAQRELPGLRPCGFHSPYEAAAWAVLSQRIRIVQAARLRAELVDRHGDHGAFPTPARLLGLRLDLPGRKAEYLDAVAAAALDGRLDGIALRSMDPEHAIQAVQEVKGLGPFAAELVVLRGANAPDGLPTHEARLDDEITERYGTAHSLSEVSEAWRPFRTWAAVHLRAQREQRTHEVGGRGGR
ncbi:DNA-3-methyladenine glycosylase 2 family protein [Mycobacterium sp. 94-17]|uniref:DNA-3-methyladenine glycosylase family protein n=1 Tax=Mycobacterium sp. 94-17 TaxID=2986147 RepID=UPI002D1F31AA|nr:DNA-3-methyladenine glycosylase 2 family protein [Mycobacterium sp. 94-17]MEB4211798.1 DNA-3-methyladenine glycosylase 2 family protein [Mycobacterium sp. 94-17]